MPKKKYLYEIDFMRMLIMFGVLSVHTTSIFTSQLKDWTTEFLALSAIHSSMHVTRMAFMFITGLVLFITYHHREFHVFSFLKKRLFLIAIPYLVWNVVYILFESTYEIDLHGSFMGFLKILLLSLIHGDQFYIYYLLITFQFYLVFPMLLFALRKYEKWHLQIFIWSFLFQLLLMSFYKFAIPHLDQSNWPYLLTNYGVFIVTYQCWFVTGGIVACHYDMICKFIEKHYRLIGAILFLGIICMWGHYYLDRAILHESDHKAQSVHQPVFLPYSLFVIAVMLYLGRKWAERRTRRNWQGFSRFVGIASSTSFGMYLVQPFPIYIVNQYIPRIANVHWLFYLSIPIAILFVYVSSMILSYCIGKIPYISYCVGQRTKKKPNTTRAISSLSQR
ncbi:acyltransferase [Heyndrickxia ginsengihumi]|uniref:acyltransferase n=1 Tax=Heyndrickxia ginsengihumi TaxID=363870 RepID=UPI00046FCA5F|nr:acyltransferase [Heyndrickxia ginsengihumi]